MYRNTIPIQWDVLASSLKIFEDVLSDTFLIHYFSILPPSYTLPLQSASRLEEGLALCLQYFYSQNILTSELFSKCLHPNSNKAGKSSELSVCCHPWISSRKFVAHYSMPSCTSSKIGGIFKGT